MKNTSYVLMILLTLFACKAQNPDKEDTEIIVEELSEVSTHLVQQRLPNLLNYQLDSAAFPRSLELNGTVRKVPSKDWTSGFYVGSLIKAYHLTNEEAYLNKALEFLPYLEKEKINDKTHDMGFKIYCSYGNAYELTKNEKYKQVILESAKTLATRFNPTIGCIRSWDFGGDQWQFPVIIDNMMNLELLFEATRLSGNSTYFKMADSHASQTLKNHFRADNSGYHVVDYDPQTGNVLQKLTHQGYSNNSAWARGQAWGLYGFIMAYRYTNNSEYLIQAEEIASFIFEHPNLPEDKIPYWDFDAPDIPEAPRDVSAATICASALLELNHVTSKGSYRDQAVAILNALNTEEYIIKVEQDVPFILQHSTGNMPKNDEVDVPISYADYYFLESLERIRKW